jgi:hypothetical protein
MQGKFVYGGEGVQVPGTGFGLSYGLFKLWLCPVGGNFKGYTTASNEGLLGFAIVESPVVDFVMTDLEDEEPFMNLHNVAVDVTISSTTFAIDGGTSTLKLVRRTNDATLQRQLSFFSDECKGFSAAIGDIHFRATLLQLPANEWDARQQNLVPW